MVSVPERAAILPAILAAVIISTGCQDQPANRITGVTPPPIRAQHGLDKERTSRFVARIALEKTLRDAGYDVRVKFSAIAGGGGDRHLFISGNSVTLAFARSSVGPDFKRNLWRCGFDKVTFTKAQPDWGWIAQYVVATDTFSDRP